MEETMEATGEKLAQGHPTAHTFHPAVRLFLDLTSDIPFSGGTVALATHPTQAKLFISVSELGQVFGVSTETKEVLSTLEVPEPFEDGPTSLAVDPSDGTIVLLVDQCITRWRDGPPWEQMLPDVDVSGDCECLSIDGCGRVLVDLASPTWLSREATWEVVPLEPRTEEPPIAEDGDLDAVYNRQVWEATTLDLSSALPVACHNGGIFFYARDSRSAHYLPPGTTHAKELSRRRERHDAVRGLVIHMESDLPEQGFCCASSNGGMFIVGAIQDDTKHFREGIVEGTLGVWSFSVDAPPSFTELVGFQLDPPAQLDAVASDASGALYLCVVEKWPDQRAIYIVEPELAS